MSQHAYTLVINIKGKYGYDSELDDGIGPDNKTREDLLKEQWENKIKEISNIEQGQNHLQFVSLTEN